MQRVLGGDVDQCPRRALQDRGGRGPATGILTAALALRQGEAAGERAMWAISGLISIALGLVLFIRPDIGALSLATVFGLFSIVHGTSALVLYFQVRNIGTAARGLTDPAAV